MSDLFTSLKDLKTKLSHLENDFRVETRTKEREKQDNNQILTQRLKELKQIQLSRKDINCGGRTYSIDAAVLERTKLPNVFAAEKEQSIFYDSSPELFSYIFDFLLKFGKDNDSITKEARHPIRLSKSQDGLVLGEMLKEIFLDNAEILEFVNIEVYRPKAKESPVQPQNPEEVNNANPYGGDYDYNRNAAYDYHY